jgi:hypothetical protein
VFVVSESFDCPGTYGINAMNDGLAQDYYTRVYNLTVVRAAGNMARDDPSHAACDFTLNAICVGGVTHQNAVNCISTTLNPRGHDREEPDVMALAGGACSGEDTVIGVDIADITRTPSNWTKSAGGTSYAAPQVAQLVALAQEDCGIGDERQVRSYIRNSAYGGNPSDTLYSTPGLGIDYKDGAGVVTALTLGACTAENQPTQGSFAQAVTLTGGRAAPFAADCPNCGHPLGLQPLRTGLGFSPTDGRKYLRVANVPTGGTRIRASLSWDSCTSVNATNAPGAPSVDFDMFLVDSAHNRVIYSSQSNDDNNEGFDVDLRQFGAGDYTIYVGWPNGAMGCTGGTTENIGFSWKSF